MRAHRTELAHETAGLSECFDLLAARAAASRPLSTYRLQFHAGFRFTHALALVRYFDRLGISHLYCSPLLKAQPGSVHGYDIADHNQINPEIGTPQQLQELSAELRAHNMGQILDVVPNHMGIGMGENLWWQDVLEYGRASRYADFFDIDWEPLRAELRNKLLLPVLGRHYGEELEHGHLKLCFEKGYFFVSYYDRTFPLHPASIPLVFAPLLNPPTPPAGEKDSPLSELRHVLGRLQSLEKIAPGEEFLKTAQSLTQHLRRLLGASSALRPVVDEALARGNGVPGNSSSFDVLHGILEAQVYRLAHWRVSGEEINYRRFFDINELVGLKVENPRVFAATHRLVRRLLAEGTISGLRIDHPDGLLNPRQYLIRIQMLYAASQCQGAEPRGPVSENGIESDVQTLFGQHDWLNRHAPMYTVVEKILEIDEELPQEWPTDGTSGYDFANLVNGIFIQQKNTPALTTLYRRFSGIQDDVDTLIYESKRLIMQSSLAGEVEVLTHLLDELARGDRNARDFTVKSLRDVVRETIATFPVYRTYIDERGELSERDRRYILAAITAAKRRNPSTAVAIFDFLRDILLLSGPENHWDETYRRKLYFTLKFQQLTGPVMAKGMEDTTCYVYNRFISVNEVGSNPRQLGVSLAAFHGSNARRASHWPFAMLATSTHDSKRSEDVRARLDVLSEDPRLWGSTVQRWRRLNRSSKHQLGDGRIVPDYNEEYFLYQTIVGSHPFEIGTPEERRHYISRINQYMTKAVHEAKVNLSWINQDPEYVNALEAFVTGILTPREGKSNPFLEHLAGFLPAISFFGAINSLAQRLLLLTCPGSPDIYQGSELWDFSLVDPDNRRPVDFEARSSLLDALQHSSISRPDICRGLLEDYTSGAIKLWTTFRALHCRRDHPQLFRSQKYTGLSIGQDKDKEDHVCAFWRETASESMVVAVPRFAYTLMNGKPQPPLGNVWGRAEINLPSHAPDFFENVLTGETLRVTNSRSLLCREVFGAFPVALMFAR